MATKLGRCTGHCCKRFALEHSYTEFQEDYRLWQVDPGASKIPQVEIIAPMLVPLGASSRHSEYVYTCKNLDSKGDCKIYEIRPQFCRDFPDESGCPFWSCTASESIYFGLSWIKKIQRRWKWLRGL